MPRFIFWFSLALTLLIIISNLLLPGISSGYPYSLEDSILVLIYTCAAVTIAPFLEEIFFRSFLKKDDQVMATCSVLIVSGYYGIFTVITYLIGSSWLSSLYLQLYFPLQRFLLEEFGLSFGLSSLAVFSQIVSLLVPAILFAIAFIVIKVFRLKTIAEFITAQLGKFIWYFTIFAGSIFVLFHLQSYFDAGIILVGTILQLAITTSLYTTACLLFGLRVSIWLHAFYNSTLLLSQFHMMYATSLAWLNYSLILYSLVLLVLITKNILRKY